MASGPDLEFRHKVVRSDSISAIARVHKLAVATVVLTGRDCFAISRIGASKPLTFQIAAAAKLKACVCRSLAFKSMDDQVCIVEVVSFRFARLTISARNMGINAVAHSRSEMVVKASRGRYQMVFISLNTWITEP